jgi:hypothetical protein
MQSGLRFCLAIALAIAGVSDLRAQFRIPIRIPARVPIRAPVPHHIPHHIPHISPANDDRQEAAAQKNAQAADDSLPWGMIIGGGSTAALVTAAYVWFRKPQRARIRIVRTPAGEAPETVRRAWVGLELPLTKGETNPRVFESRGVLSNQATESVVGYMVDGSTAVRLLEGQSPDAAAWWRENVPDIETPGYRLGFSAGDCERLGWVG